MGKLVKASVEIEKDQRDWLKKNNYSLSPLVRQYLNEFIGTMERTKQGIAVPAIVKAADDDTIRERLKKNPKLRHLVD